MQKKTSKIKSVKDKADIEKVISHFIKLKKDGVNWRSRCPFHDEKSRSFTVSPTRNIWKCFGCGKAGDVVDFVMAQKSLSFMEATSWIANFENISIDPEYVEKEFVEPPTSFIFKSVYRKSLAKSKGKKTNFTEWLKTVFEKPKVIYPITASSEFGGGSIIFWYFDVNDNIRSGKIMQYNPETGKRIKDPEPEITWVHRVQKLRDFNMNVCLYGEHLLKKFPNKKVYIVESEKSAIVASIFFPQFLWLASGSLSNLMYERCKVLHGRDVTVMPDVGAEPMWQARIDELSEIMSDTKWNLKSMGDSHEKGYDICDFILNTISNEKQKT